MSNMPLKKSKEDSAKTSFQWSDDEIELLLVSINECKASKEAKSAIYAACLDLRFGPQSSVELAEYL